ECPGALRGWSSTACSPRSTRESHSSPCARGQAARSACGGRASRARLPCASPRRRPCPSPRSYSPACQRLCNETPALTHLLASSMRPRGVTDVRRIPEKRPGNAPVGARRRNFSSTVRLVCDRDLGSQRIAFEEFQLPAIREIDRRVLVRRQPGGKLRQ